MSSHYDPRVHSQKRQTMNPCIPILLTPPQSDAIGFASSWLDQLKAWLTSPEGGIAWGLHLLGFLAVLATARIASNVLGKIARKAASTSRLAGSELLKDFFENSVRKAVMLIGFVMALGQLGVEIGPLLAGLAGASFVLGFALQESLNNFAAGIMLLLYRPYDIGDWVAKMNLLMEKPDLACKMGEEGRALAVRDYSPARFDRDVVAFLRELLQ